jgi:hypothetical protein
MVRHTDADDESPADIDPTTMSTDQLIQYIDRVAQTAANLPDGEYAEPVLTANAEVAIAELKSRNPYGVDRDDTADADDHLNADDREPTDAERGFGDTVDAFETAVADAVTDGGDTDPVEAKVDAHSDADTEHFLRDAEPEQYDIKIRHDGSIRTVVEDGTVVHKVVEQYSDDADGESLSHAPPTCPVHDGHRNRERTRVDDDGIIRLRYTCDGDDGDCPFDATIALRAGTAGDDVDDGLPSYDDPDYERPLWYRATIPHDFDDEFDAASYSDLVDASDNNRTEVAQTFRRLSVNRNVERIRDAAYNKAQYNDDGKKTADRYIDTFDCARCGDTHDAGAEHDHPAHDDPVCIDCKDDRVWSVDDADVPDDVADVFDEYASVTPTKVRSLLTDVAWWQEFIASAREDASGDGGMFTVNTYDDDVDPDDIAPCPTGKQGVRKVQGHGSPGTGFRRPDGFAHGDAHFRTVIRKAREVGLIERVDGNDDADFDDPNARWDITDKGTEVLHELAVCPWCGDRLRPTLRVHTYKISRYNTTTDRELTLRCPCGCRDSRNGSFTTLHDKYTDD